MGKRWNLVHEWTIASHGSKYCNGSSDELIHMETKKGNFHFAK
jgi:hypothetical protein